MAISIISQTIHMGNIKGVAMAILFAKFNLVTEQNSQKYAVKIFWYTVCKH